MMIPDFHQDSFKYEKLEERIVKTRRGNCSTGTKTTWNILLHKLSSFMLPGSQRTDYMC